MLLRGRIDFMIVSESGREAYTKFMGMEVDDMIPLTYYNYPVIEYLVGNKNVDTRFG